MSEGEDYGLRAGDRVMATETAYENGVFLWKDAPIYGTVVRLATVSDTVLIRREGQKGVYRFHVSFWTPANP